MHRYFGNFVGQLGVSMDDLLRLGRPDHDPEGMFNMAVMGLRLAGRSNGVAQLHGAVSRQMFNHLWPDVPENEVPIGAITNGVHAHTWVGDHIAALLAKGVGPVWDGADEASWQGVDRIDPTELWAARAKARAELVAFVRSRMGDALLDPKALTIGFARRFATYKRATLLLSQPDRLRSMLLSADRPVQFVFAGKAHPQDQPGKDMIRDIELFARQLDVNHRFVFVPDYDMAIARMMYHGCDVWLNNPRRPLEACGTSGMKAALNGALNCSILDGWWDECFDGSNGWAINSADDDPDLNRRDAREATSLFGLLEREIVPLFYDRTDGVPMGWIETMRQNWRSLGPYVTAARMVRNYATELYEPAAASSRTALAEHGQVARDLAAWKQRVRAAWPEVKLVSLDGDTSPAHEGELRHVIAHVDIDGLEPESLTVQALHGPIDSEGEFLGLPKIVTLTHTSSGVWEADYTVGEAGPYGLTVRAMPSHPQLISPVEMGIIAWAN
jgi:starch phosphorylase